MTTAPAAVPRSVAPRPLAAPAIEMNGLIKRYPKQRSWRELLRPPFRREWVSALRQINLQIAHGEFFGILGPNGAGKTTLFKILSTLIEPDGGEVVVHGRRATTDAHAVRGLVTPVIADERSLRWRLSASENLRLYAALYNVPKPSISGRIDRLLEVVGLADVGERMVGAFSTGMKQRLALARALLAEPAILLLDEPTRSLDPLSARSLRTFLREEIGARRGTTILLATHLAEEAFHLCDRVGVLHQGRLLACGTTEQLMKDFANDAYRIWTTTPEHPALQALKVHEAPGHGGDDWQADDWRVMEVHLSSDEDPANLLRRLVTAGVPIARFERVQLSLADLIERVVEQQGVP